MAISDEFVFVSPEEAAWIQQHHDEFKEWLAEIEAEDAEWWMVLAVFLGGLEAAADWLREHDSELAETFQLIRIKSMALEAQSLAARSEL